MMRGQAKDGSERDMPQEPYSGFKIAEEEFADNPDPRVACVLLLDTSGSMGGAPIAELNTGLQQYRDELLLDNIASSPSLPPSTTRRSNSPCFQGRGAYPGV